MKQGNSRRLQPSFDKLTGAVFLSATAAHDKVLLSYSEMPCNIIEYGEEGEK